MTRFLPLVPVGLVMLAALVLAIKWVVRAFRGAARVVEQARSEVWSTCPGCNAHEWEHHDPQCPEVAWLERLFAAPAYGEER